MVLPLERIQHLSLKEPKTLEQRMIKLMEEAGELAQEVLVETKASGVQHKQQGADGLLGECVDVLLVCLSIYFGHGGTMQELQFRIGEKCAKWEKTSN